MNKNFFYLLLLASCAGAGYYFLHKKGYTLSKSGGCCGHSHDNASHNSHFHEAETDCIAGDKSSHASALHEITTVEELDTILNLSEPVVIKVFAEWCPPCKAASAVFPEIVAEFPNTRFYELNVSQATIVKELHTKGIVEKPVSSIPAFICIKNGKELTTLQGFKDKEDLIVRLKAIL